jgi:hypothetical protein
MNLTSTSTLLHLCTSRIDSSGLTAPPRSVDFGGCQRGTPFIDNASCLVYSATTGLTACADVALQCRPAWRGVDWLLLVVSIVAAVVIASALAAACAFFLRHKCGWKVTQVHPLPSKSPKRRARARKRPALILELPPITEASEACAAVYRSIGRNRRHSLISQHWGHLSLSSVFWKRHRLRNRRASWTGRSSCSMSRAKP